MTNADRIRKMTDEELAEFLYYRDLDAARIAVHESIYKFHYCDVRNWLNQESKNDREKR